jgi:L-lactate utilization protein LutB
VIHLPDMAVVNETAGKIVIVTNEGNLKRKVEVIIVPTPDVEVVANDAFIPKAPTEVLGN